GGGRRGRNGAGVEPAGRLGVRRGAGVLPGRAHASGGGDRVVGRPCLGERAHRRGGGSGAVRAAFVGSVLSDGSPAARDALSLLRWAGRDWLQWVESGA